MVHTSYNRALAVVVVIGGSLFSLASALSQSSVERFDMCEPTKRDDGTRCAIGIAGEADRLGGKLQLEVLLQCGGEGVFYDVFFDPLLPKAAVVAMFDDKRQYLGNLLTRSIGSNRSPSRKDFMYLKRGAQLKYTIPVQLRRFDKSIIGSTVEPGVYYIQIIYNSHFFSEPRIQRGSDDFEESAISNWINDSNTDVMRSNSLRIVLK